MRSVRSQGRPGTAVVPPDWAASHGVVAAGFCSATVNLRQPGTADQHWDEVLGRTVSDPYTPYAEDVPAQIRPIAADNRTGPGTVAVGDSVRVTGYVIAVPRSFVGSDDPEFKANTVVEVVTCDDPLLVGRTLNVNDVVRGTLRFSRELIAVLND